MVIIPDYCCRRPKVVDNGVMLTTTNLRNLAWILLFASSLSACATVAGFPGAQGTAETWKKIADCNQDAKENAVKANCAEKFKDTQFTVQVHHVANPLPRSGKILLYANFGSTDKTFCCALDEKTFHERLVRLSKGDIVKVKGRIEVDGFQGAVRQIDTGTTRVFGGPIYNYWISLDPCTLSSE